MIDRTTGELIIGSVLFRLGPDFTLEQFESCLLANSARSLVKNEPFCSFSCGSQEISDVQFLMSLWFYAEKLESIELVHSAAELGTSWADWSETSELKRKNFHDQWLVSLLGRAPYAYDWGTITSDYDMKSGGSSITIRYSWQGNPL